MEFTPLPGFRDFFPEEAVRRDYIFQKWRQTALKYGFLPCDGPPLELTELYRRKSGDELLGQLYSFTDKGDRQVTLRPEATPSLARMIAHRGQSLPKPIKWFSIPQLFRYERQQRGRLREHYQFNCDIIGESGIESDVELIALLTDSLRAFGLTAADFRVRINDRSLVAELAIALGLKEEEHHNALFAAADKLLREPPEKIRGKLTEAGIQPAVADQALELFKLKNLREIAARFNSHPAVCERVMVLQHLFGMLEAIGLKDYVEFDFTVVRGLAYYTGVVFEAFDRRGTFRAISGGGRYDQLFKRVGEVDLPALGFGMGDVVLGEILSERNLWPAKLLPSPDVFMVLIDKALLIPSLFLAHQLREKGWSVDHALSATAVNRQFKMASQRGARIAVVMGPEEWKRGAVKLKNLESREETELPAEKIVEFLANITDVIEQKSQRHS